MYSEIGNSDIMAGDYVKVNVTNSRNDNIAMDLKFTKSMTVYELKNRLQIITGNDAGTMTVELYRADELVTVLDDNCKTLDMLPIESGMRLHVKGYEIFDSATDVEKLTLSDDKYESMDNTLRSFLKRNALGKYNKEEAKQEENKQIEKLNMEKQKAQDCTINSRCQVSVKGQPLRRGTIKYNGPLEGKTGLFIGVQYDEPLGKNDGSFNGKYYFNCPQNYGAFVSPLYVEVGDFPEDDYNLNDEI